MSEPKILLSAQEAADLLGISLRTFRDRSKATDFPAPRSLGPRVNRWLRAELEAFAQRLPVYEGGEPAHLAAAREHGVTRHVCR